MLEMLSDVATRGKFKASTDFIVTKNGGADELKHLMLTEGKLNVSAPHQTSCTGDHSFRFQLHSVSKPT
jgi:hypothetical protein